MNTRGVAYIEYLVIALLVLMATLTFFEGNLQQEHSAIRAKLTSVFIDVCKKVAGSDNCG